MDEYSYDGYSEYPVFPKGTLDHHYSIIVLRDWAIASNFPVAFSGGARAKLAGMIAGWPTTFRDATAVLVLEWMSVIGFDKTLCDAITQR